MAENIIKLKVDSQEYDAKIKRATEGIRHYADECRKVGGTLAVVEDETLEFVRSLGQMETVAKGGMQGMRELTRAATDLTIQYRQLTDEEKNSPFGQSLKGSIDQLIHRAGDMKDAMADVQREVTGIASDTRIFDQLAGAANLTTSSFQTLQGAGKLLGIEMGDNVEVIAKLQAAMAVTNGLTQIQNILQKESAFMQGVSAAKTSLHAAAQKLLGTNIAGATTAQKAMNVAIAAAPWAAAIAAAYAIASAIDLFGESADDAAERQEKLNRSLENTKKLLQDIANEMSYNEMYMKATGYGDDAILDAKIKSAQQQLAVAQQELDKAKREEKNIYVPTDNGSVASAVEMIANNKNIGVLIDQKKKVEELNKIVDEAQGNLDNLLKERDTRKRIATDIEANFKGFSTERQIQSAISYFTKLRSEAEKGSEAWVKYDDNITKLNIKLKNLRGENNNKTTTNNTGGGGSITSKVKIDTTESLTELQLLKDELKTVENSMAPYGKATDEWKTMNEYAEELRGKIRALNGEFKELATGTNIQNTAGMSSFINGIKADLENADFGSELYNSLSAQLADMTTLQNLVGESLKVGLGTAMFDVADELGMDFWTRAMEGGVENVDWQAIVDKINEKRKEKGLDLLELDDKGRVKIQGKEKKNEVSLTKELGLIISGVTGIFNGIESLGIELPQGMKDVMGGIQNMISILTGISTIISTIEAISAADAIIPFAHGGIVGHAASGLLVGNSYSGDNVRLPIVGSGSYIGVNDGELILNKAQQGMLASELHGGIGNVEVPPYLTGELIYLGLQAYTRRSGMGEIVTTNNR